MLKKMSSDTKVTDKQEIMHLDGFRGLYQYFNSSCNRSVNNKIH